MVFKRTRYLGCSRESSVLILASFFVSNVLLSLFSTILLASVCVSLGSAASTAVLSPNSRIPEIGTTPSASEVKIERKLETTLGKGRRDIVGVERQEETREGRGRRIEEGEEVRRGGLVIGGGVVEGGRRGARGHVSQSLSRLELKNSERVTTHPKNSVAVNVREVGREGVREFGVRDNVRENRESETKGKVVSVHETTVTQATTSGSITNCREQHTDGSHSRERYDQQKPREYLVSGGPVQSLVASASTSEDLHATSESRMASGQALELPRPVSTSRTSFSDQNTSFSTSERISNEASGDVGQSNVGSGVGVSGDSNRNDLGGSSRSNESERSEEESTELSPQTPRSRIVGLPKSGVRNGDDGVGEVQSPTARPPQDTARLENLILLLHQNSTNSVNSSSTSPASPSSSVFLITHAHEDTKRPLHHYPQPQGGHEQREQEQVKRRSKRRKKRKKMENEIGMIELGVVPSALSQFDGFLRHNLSLDTSLVDDGRVSHKREQRPLGEEQRKKKKEEEEEEKEEEEEVDKEGDIEQVEEGELKKNEDSEDEDGQEEENGDEEEKERDNDEEEKEENDDKEDEGGKEVYEDEDEDEDADEDEDDEENITRHKPKVRNVQSWEDESKAEQERRTPLENRIDTTEEMEETLAKLKHKGELRAEGDGEGEGERSRGSWQEKEEAWVTAVSEEKIKLDKNSEKREASPQDDERRIIEEPGTTTTTTTAVPTAGGRKTKRARPLRTTEDEETEMVLTEEKKDEQEREARRIEENPLSNSNIPVRRDTSGEIGGGEGGGGGGGGGGGDEEREVGLTIPGSSTVVTRAGQTASLTCNVKQLGNRQLSWIRGRDLHVLSSGLVTFASDSRVRVSNNGESWTLTISYTQPRDAGSYACQVNTQPPVGKAYNLTVIEARARIHGQDAMYVQAGSTFSLECVVKEELVIPGLILWYHDDALVDRESGRIQVNTTQGDSTISRLRIAHANHHDSGNYSCWPSSGRPDSVIVHIIQGEPPAAMQHANIAADHSIKFLAMVLVVTSIVLPTTVLLT
ncbi:uncharacterized protein LOC143026016 [Oratosquilla oratoria]|uniref:uncharacterized protein LOC143026016 n=1 Tax=Oratosquilla oratoria TaxID=337810 RepID=UPI003F77722E